MDQFKSPTDSPQESQSSDSPQTLNSSVSSSPADLAPDCPRDTDKSSQCDAQMISVYIPDLFSSILAVKPIVNPNYFEVKAEADSWITQYACLDHPLRWTQIIPWVKVDRVSRLLRESDKWAARYSKVDFAYLASIWAPSCDEDTLRMMVDWTHWVSSGFIHHISQFAIG